MQYVERQNTDRLREIRALRLAEFECLAANQNPIRKENKTMDQIKTGRFIKLLRTEKQLTQREIAEKLNISEKTVSKWETGNGLPEVSLMLPLCEILEISVNELLSGERLDTEKYYEKAEENILTLSADKIAPKTKTVVCNVSCILTVLSALAIVLIASFINIDIWLRLVMIGIALICVGNNIAVILIVAVSTEVFECANCKETFVPTLKEYIMSAHTLKRRYLKCPRCGKKSWNKSKVNKKD